MHIGCSVARHWRGIRGGCGDAAVLGRGPPWTGPTIRMCGFAYFVCVCLFKFLGFIYIFLRIDLGSCGPCIVHLYARHNTVNFGRSSKQLRNHQNPLGSWSHITDAARCEVCFRISRVCCWPTLTQMHFTFYFRLHRADADATNAFIPVKMTRCVIRSHVSTPIGLCRPVLW